jgi:hypothetical protein
MQSSTLDVQSLVARVERLERQNRLFKRLELFLLLSPAILIVMAQARPRRTVQADEFQLIDASGSVRARLSMEAAGRPTLNLLDEKGIPVVSLAAGDDPFLVLKRAGGKEEVALGAYNGSYGLGLYDKKIRAGLTVQNGAPGLDLFDEVGDERAKLLLNDVGPLLELSNRGGFTSGAGPAGFFLAQEGKVCWSAP